MQAVTANELEERYGTATERRVELHERFQQWCSADRRTAACLDFRQFCNVQARARGS